MSNFVLIFNMFCDMIDQIIDYNKDFVARKGYEKYLTDKYPDKKTGGALMYGYPPDRITGSVPLITIKQ